MKNRGSVLIVVLWALFILGALAIAISGYTGSQINLAERLSQKAGNYYLARAAVFRGIMEIGNDQTEKYDAAGDKWSDNDAVFKSAPLGGGSYSVLKPALPGEGESRTVKYGFSDEERKINVNKASEDVLKSFFEIVGGVSAEEAEGIAASIADWRDEDDEARKNGAETFHYQALSRPYKAKDADIEVLEELLLVKGMTGSVFNKTKDRLTVYGSGAVNINTADELVLRSIGMSEELAKKITYFRDSPQGEKEGAGDNFFDDAANIVGALEKKESLSAEESGKINYLVTKGFLCVESSNFSALAEGDISAGPGLAQIAFVFDRKTSAIRYWRER